jgi:hypothetical protein
MQQSNLGPGCDGGLMAASGVCWWWWTTKMVSVSWQQWHSMAVVMADCKAAAKRRGQRGRCRHNNQMEEGPLDALRCFLTRKALVAGHLQDDGNGASVGLWGCIIVGVAAVVHVGGALAVPSNVQVIGCGFGGSMSIRLWWGHFGGGRQWRHIRESTVACWLCWNIGGVGNGWSGSTKQPT